ncbi:D-tyrosyl-tRNA(Tyr) deacylase [Taxawa tesnikishii (nom. ined.)]|nr:D-tyrosyl-tRNA(Tyr) deacylase [Dothideales sp. JES 119]
MKTVLQRVKSASVTVDGQLISTIGKGILVFAAVGKDDTQKEVESMASKILKVKLWDDDEGKKWKRNVQEIEGEVLCVSQFTLLASTKKGNKPDFHKSAGPNQARELYDRFFSKVQALYKTERVKNGVFQAMMDVGLVNDGPVGVDYTCEDGAVTIEINTDPPPMDNPTPFELPKEGESFKGKVQQTFTLPASLLE